MQNHCFSISLTAYSWITFIGRADATSLGELTLRNSKAHQYGGQLPLRRHQR